MELFYWVSFLAWNLLLLAVITAMAARCKSKFWKRFWPGLATVLQGLSAIVFVFGGTHFLKQKLQPQSFFWYSLLFMTGYLAGAVVILKIGSQGSGSDKPAAAAWPRLKLTAAFAVLLAMNLGCLEIAQLNAMNDLLVTRTTATAELMNLMPPKVPDHLNARLVYEEAFERFPSRKDLPEWFHDVPTSDFDPTHPGVVDFLEQHRDVLSLAIRAAGMPAYCPEINSMNYVEWRMVNFGMYRNLARLMCLDAVLQANTGNFTGAGETLAAIRNMSIHLDKAPFLVSFAISNVIDEIRVKSLAYILSNTSNPMEGFTAFPIKTRPINLQRVASALRLETLGQLQGFTIIAAANKIRMLPSEEGTEPRQPTGRTKFWRAFFMQSDLRAARDIIAGNLNREFKSYADLEASLEKIQQAYESGQMGIFTSISTISYSGFVVRAKYRDAYEGLADLALGAAAYKNTTGHYPEAADDLVPQYIEKIPMDPFDGQALKINLTDDGIDLHTAEPEAFDIPGLKNRGAIHFRIEKKDLY